MPLLARSVPRRRPRRQVLALAPIAALAACGGGNERPEADIAAAQVTTIGVNSYLWRASLEALSFMPLAQACLLYTSDAADE